MKTFLFPLALTLTLLCFGFRHVDADEGVATGRGPVIRVSRSGPVEVHDTRTTVSVFSNKLSAKTATPYRIDKNVISFSDVAFVDVLLEQNADEQTVVFTLKGMQQDRFPLRNFTPHHDTKEEFVGGKGVIVRSSFTDTDKKTVLGLAWYVIVNPETGAIWHTSIAFR